MEGSGTGVSGVLLDHGGTMVTDREGDPDAIFFDLLREEKIDVKRSELHGASEYFQMYWAENYSHLPRGTRWTLEIRAKCNEAVLEHYRVPCNPSLLGSKIAKRFESMAHPSLFADVRPTLEALHTMGMKLGVVSQHLYTSQELKSELDDWGIGHFFTMVLTSETAGIDKPDPTLYREAAARLRLPVQEVCHVGNSLVNDALSAQRAGMRGILVDREGKEPRLEGLPVIRALTELPLIL